MVDLDDYIEFDISEWEIESELDDSDSDSDYKQYAAISVNSNTDDVIMSYEMKL